MLRNHELQQLRRGFALVHRNQLIFSYRQLRDNVASASISVLPNTILYRWIYLTELVNAGVYQYEIASFIVPAIQELVRPDAAYVEVPFVAVIGENSDYAVYYGAPQIDALRDECVTARNTELYDPTEVAKRGTKVRQETGEYLFPNLKTIFELRYRR